jgi:hypothetical protein
MVRHAGLDPASSCFADFSPGHHPDCIKTNGHYDVFSIRWRTFRSICPRGISRKQRPSFKESTMPPISPPIRRIVNLATAIVLAVGLIASPRPCRRLEERATIGWPLGATSGIHCRHHA